MNTINDIDNEVLHNLELSVVETIHQYQSVPEFKDTTTDHYSLVKNNAFKKKSIISFPDLLNQHVNNAEHRYKMGFISVLDRVWLAVGNKLFIWNYRDSNNIFKYECFEKIEQIDIIQLTNTNNYELIISTASKLFVHSIIEDNNRLKIVSKTAVSTDNTVMSNIVSTDTKRVFMQGNEGHVYELSILFTSEHLATSCKLTNCTNSTLAYYLPYFFKFTPEVKVKSMLLDNPQKILYILYDDSSIQSINVQGTQFVLNYQYKGTHLDSIHLIPPTELSNINFMAVTSSGNRRFFNSTRQSMTLIHTRIAPPLPGHLLFNNLTEESVDLSFYSYNIYAAVLSKSNKKYFIMLSTDHIDIPKEGWTVTEDMYLEENTQHKVWDLKEDNPPNNLLHGSHSVSLQSPDRCGRQILSLTKKGITHYIEQRPVDRLSELISSHDHIGTLQFQEYHGAAHTLAMALSLACLPTKVDGINEYIMESNVMNDGVKLYFSALVAPLWEHNIVSEQINEEEMNKIQQKMEHLQQYLQRIHVDIKDEINRMLTRSIEGISFLLFVHSSYKSVLKDVQSEGSINFGHLVMSEKGEQVLKLIVNKMIERSECSDKHTSHCVIGDFLYNHCLSLLGKENILFYKGNECLRSAKTTSTKKEALHSALNNYIPIIALIRLDQVQTICNDFCSLQDYQGAVSLAYKKYQLGKEAQDILSVLYRCFSLSFQQSESVGIQVVSAALDLCSEKNHHSIFYAWLDQSEWHDALFKIENPSLIHYMKTELSSQDTLKYLHIYFKIRKDYLTAIDCYLKLCTELKDVDIKSRVDCLDEAYALIPLLHSADADQEIEKLRALHKEAHIQYTIYQSLVTSDNEDQKKAASALSTELKSASDLFQHFANIYALYKEGLQLMDIMHLFDWNFSKRAWTHIIDKSVDEKTLQSELTELGQAFYPSISSFPVYIIVQLLHKHISSHSHEFIKETLTTVGVPKEVIDDALNEL
ncbi:Nup133 N terminal like-domain-containing protein [Pilobolus umbonatus]|nr:Nup133 N terminal like-domain-containing protein [Pilobolus umbonatus]